MKVTLIQNIWYNDSWKSAGETLDVSDDQGELFISRDIAYPFHEDAVEPVEVLVDDIVDIPVDDIVDIPVPKPKSKGSKKKRG